jgi:hypothetical protein
MCDAFRFVLAAGRLSVVRCRRRDAVHCINVPLYVATQWRLVMQPGLSATYVVYALLLSAPHGSLRT